MRKCIYVFLVLMSCLIMSSCSKEQREPDNTDLETTTQYTEEELDKILLMYQSNITLGEREMAEQLREILEQNGVDLNADDSIQLYKQQLLDRETVEDRKYKEERGIESSIPLLEYYDVNMYPNGNPFIIYDVKSDAYMEIDDIYSLYYDSTIQEEDETYEETD